MGWKYSWVQTLLGSKERASKRSVAGTAHAEIAARAQLIKDRARQRLARADAKIDEIIDTSLTG